MTAVLQVCWIFLGIQSLLSSLGVGGQLRFERRLTSVARKESLILTDLPILWPHSFFRPTALSCGMESGNSKIIMETPYAQYQLRFDASAAKLSPVSSSSFAAGDNLLGCSPLGCTKAQLEDGGRVLSVRQGTLMAHGEEVNKRYQDPHTLHLEIQGQPWLKMAGLQLPCATVQLLLGFQSNRTCYVFAGWDGEHLPLVALEIPANSELVAVITPRVDAPLEGLTDLTALHMAQNANGVRLWALLPGQVEAWDLSSLVALGTWKLDGASCLEATSLCEASALQLDDQLDSLLLAGFVEQRPHLFRAQLPKFEGLGVLGM